MIRRTFGVIRNGQSTKRIIQVVTHSSRYTRRCYRLKRTAGFSIGSKQHFTNGKYSSPFSSASRLNMSAVICHSVAEGSVELLYFFLSTTA